MGVTWNYVVSFSSYLFLFPVRLCMTPVDYASSIKCWPTNRSKYQEKTPEGKTSNEQRAGIKFFFTTCVTNQRSHVIWPLQCSKYVLSMKIYLAFSLFNVIPSFDIYVRIEWSGSPYSLLYTDFLYEVSVNFMNSTHFIFCLLNLPLRIYSSIESCPIYDFFKDPVFGLGWFSLLFSSFQVHWFML